MAKYIDTEDKLAKEQGFDGKLHDHVGTVSDADIAAYEQNKLAGEPVKAPEVKIDESIPAREDLAANPEVAAYMKQGMSVEDATRKVIKDRDDLIRAKQLELEAADIINAGKQNDATPASMQTGTDAAPAAAKPGTDETVAPAATPAPTAAPAGTGSSTTTNTTNITNVTNAAGAAEPAKAAETAAPEAAAETEEEADDTPAVDPIKEMEASLASSTKALRDAQLGQEKDFASIVANIKAQQDAEQAEISSRYQDARRASKFTGVTELASAIANMIGVGSHGSSHQTYKDFSKDWMTTADNLEREARAKQQSHSSALRQLEMQRASLKAQNAKTLAANEQSYARILQAERKAQAQARYQEAISEARNLNAQAAALNAQLRAEKNPTEIKKLEAQIAKLNADTNLAYKRANSEAAKAGMYGAHAGLYNSQAGLNDARAEGQRQQNDLRAVPMLGE